MEKISYKILIVLASLLASSSALAISHKPTSDKPITKAIDMSKLRAGAGIGIVDADYTRESSSIGLPKKDSDDADPAYFMEVGYDLNKIVGFSSKLGSGEINYKSKYSDQQSSSTVAVMEDHKYKIHYLQLVTDLGYTFKLAKRQYIKPYFELGVDVSNFEDTSTITASDAIIVTATTAVKNSSASILIGAGVRYAMSHAFYVNASYEESGLDAFILKTLNVSAGYKF